MLWEHAEKVMDAAIFGDRPPAMGAVVQGDPLLWGLLDTGGKLIYSNPRRENILMYQSQVKTPTQLIALVAQHERPTASGAGDLSDWPEEPTPEMQQAGASAIRFDTTIINKIWTANAVYRAMRAAMKGGAA